MCGSRTQYPLRLAYALTITRSQGQTLEQAVIDLGPNERTLGLAFVALSRLKNFTDFLIPCIWFTNHYHIKSSCSGKLKSFQTDFIAFLSYKPQTYPFTD